MKTYKTNELFKILEIKNIKTQRGDRSIFKKYSYFQTLNAYKSLFVDDIEDINKILQNISAGINLVDYTKYYKIKSYSNVQNLQEQVCKAICKKYEILYNKNSTIKELESKINQISYLRHVYNSNAKYSDFVRMYKFEHELRSVLLKYTLIIEENMKNIFIRCLNDSKEINANYLTNMNSYNTDMNNNSALKTLKLIVDKHTNDHSMPIKRKRKQNLPIPYWILINELAMNQTYHAINNLKPNMERLIFQECMNYFTHLNVDLNLHTPNSKPYIQINEQIDVFKSILSYIGEFRNILAHNQPIYSYNVKDFCLESYPNISYTLPKTKSVTEQYKINASLMYKLQEFFGPDSFNRNNYNRNINLSFMIYFMYKIIVHIDSNTTFYLEIKNLFVKYNIILTEYRYNISDYESVSKLVEMINDLAKIKINVRDTFDRIENKKPYKRDFFMKYNKLDSAIRSINIQSKKVKIEKIKSKYNVFSRNNKYFDYTGINGKFFLQIN